MIRIKPILYVLILFLYCSCEKVIFEKGLSATDPYTNFEYLWNQCNEKYAYFDLKEINWDEVKTVYSHKIHKGMSEDSLFIVLGDMLKELRDDHANLVSNFGTSFYGVEYEAQDNFDWRLIVDQYIGREYDISGPFAHNFIADKQIGYIRLSTFTKPIKQESLDFILNRYQNTQGLILDLRENGGGSIFNVFQVLSRFVDSEIPVYYSRIKAGLGHDNFTEALEAYVEPYDGIRYTKNVMVLTDRGTYSSGSLLALATKALPQLSLVGDTTGGGLGIPNGGQLPNGWTYRFSITQTLTLDKKPDYENGVPPDFSIMMDWNNPETDEIIEKAMKELL